MINLTYGRNSAGDVLHERSVLLTYSDIQKFLKLLRRHGYPVRYFVTGEYGNEKGRAHWHLILFWQDKVPDFAGWDQYGDWLTRAEDEQRFNWVRVDENKRAVMDPKTGEPLWLWPHGFAYVQPVTQKSVQYVCYYVLKELDHEGRQYHCAQSKKPPLGMAYFEQLAERMVEAGIAPQNPAYKFPGVTRRKKAGGREVIPFWLKDRPLEMFLDHYIAMWAEQKPHIRRPASELVDLYEEWGRVVSEEVATAKSVEHITTRKMLEGLRPPRKEYDGSLWAPLFRMQAWWTQYFEGFGDGEERQREDQDVQYWTEWVEKYDQCIENGAEPWRELERRTSDAKRALANYHSFETVEQWNEWRKSGPQHTALDPERANQFGLGKVGQWNADHAEPKPEAGRPGSGARR